MKNYICKICELKLPLSRHLPAVKESNSYSNYRASSSSVPIEPLDTQGSTIEHIIGEISKQYKLSKRICSCFFNTLIDLNAC